MNWNYRDHRCTLVPGETGIDFDKPDKLLKQYIDILASFIYIYLDIELYIDYKIECPRTEFNEFEMGR